MIEIVIDVYDNVKQRTISYILAPLSNSNEFIKETIKNNAYCFMCCIDTGHDLVYKYFELDRYAITGMHAIKD